MRIVRQNQRPHNPLGKEKILTKKILLSTMSKLIYTAPELELLEMEVEQGFLGSAEGTGLDYSRNGYGVEED